ncbi:histidine kinase dimerization/phosphoacceptor domain -containing protein [uncultured Sphingomonas sp.]|uniref:sensor histidine kinase n=1 Tax=uncultured Sphingomonas sp. TaxID=158754 RepID=UPI0030F7C486
MNWFDQLQTFMPHGMCLLWRPELMILHIGSDALIALAYFAIPFGIARFVAGRTDLDQGHRYLALLFAAFIGLCGVTHVASIMVLWYPFYVTEGWLKAITAVASIATAVFALTLVPKLLRLPSMKALQEEIDEHQSTFLELNAARAALALRVDLTESELRQARQDHADSDKLLKTVIEAVPGAIYAKDRMSRMLIANRSALRFIGQPWAVVAGRSDDQFLYDVKQARAIMANDQLVMSTNTTQEMEEVITLPDGNLRTFLSTKVPLSDDAGGTSGIVGVSIDITDRKKAEAEARQHIEHALAEKTKALQQRDMLIREVYHRVKNNLQIIDSLLVMQIRTIDDADARGALNNMRGRVYALGLVHHQLMSAEDFSTFDLAPFLQELVENIVEGSASSEIAVSVDAEPMTVGLDFAIPFGLLVTELVTNAIKHAFPSGEGSVTVRVMQVGDGNVTLIVKDDGCGSATVASESAAKRNGLGKSIIDGMVRQLQGSISYKIQNGTIVEVLLKGPPVR